jgi:5-methylcytosine-specific restriction endonuclease McrA
MNYPNLWKLGRIQEKVKSRAGWCCEHCGMAFGRDNLALEVKRRDGRPMVLTVHHIDANPANCAMDNLVALCQRCHLKVQRWRPGQYLKSTTPPSWVEARSLPYKVSPQLELMGGGE